MHQIGIVDVAGPKRGSVPPRRFRTVRCKHLCKRGGFIHIGLSIRSATPGLTALYPPESIRHEPTSLFGPSARVNVFLFVYHVNIPGLGPAVVFRIFDNREFKDVGGIEEQTVIDFYSF